MKAMLLLLLLSGCAARISVAPVPVPAPEQAPVVTPQPAPVPVSPLVRDYRSANHAALDYVVRPDADPDRIAHLTRLEADAKTALSKVQYDRRHGRPVAADLRAARRADKALRDYARTSGN